MNYYDELKSKNDIIEVAFELGYNGEKAGSSYQGDCPKHISESGKCLVIWPSAQSAYCFHCSWSGDVIDLVMLFKGCDHDTARNYLADRVGMQHLDLQALPPEEKKKKEAEYQEKILVEDMLTAAAYWYHNQLENFPNIKGILTKHYGFSEKIIQELKIGYAPPAKDGFSELAKYLNTIEPFKGKLALIGLFYFKLPEGPYFDHFQHRIVFPYWKNGKVVYMAGRNITEELLKEEKEKDE